jgi:hypothetical protein
MFGDLFFVSARPRLELRVETPEEIEAKREAMRAKQKTDCDFARSVGEIARSLPPGPYVWVHDLQGKEYRVSRFAAPSAIARGLYELIDPPEKK